MSTPTTRIRVCHVDDMAAGSALKFEHDGLIFAIFNIDGAFYATDNACTHGPGELAEGELYDDVIECNFHGGRFNVRTGEVVGAPCMIPVKTYPVTVEDGHVFVII